MNDTDYNWQRYILMKTVDVNRLHLKGALQYDITFPKYKKGEQSLKS